MPRGVCRLAAASSLVVDRYLGKPPSGGPKGAGRGFNSLLLSRAELVAESTKTYLRDLRRMRLEGKR